MSPKERELALQKYQAQIAKNIADMKDALAQLAALNGEGKSIQHYAKV